MFRVFRAEKQTFLLQKEKSQLEVRLSDVRKAQTFLQDVTELNRQYRDYRHNNAEEKETVRLSSSVSTSLCTVLLTGPLLYPSMEPPVCLLWYRSSSTSAPGRPSIVQSVEQCLHAGSCCAGFINGVWVLLVQAKIINKWI